jgi:hypothetical protein
MIEITTTNGYVTFVDDCDADLALMKWHGNVRPELGKVYVMGFVMEDDKRRVLKLHRVIASRMEGRELDRREDVDHLDDDPLNNCRSNLRAATRTQNRMNTKLQRNNTSGFKGVSPDKRTGKWIARLAINGKLTHLGVFDKPEAAHRRYCEAAIEHYGPYANDGTRPLRLADAPVATRQLPLFGDMEAMRDVTPVAAPETEAA